MLRRRIQCYEGAFTTALILMRPTYRKNYFKALAVGLGNRYHMYLGQAGSKNKL
jgi:hypothetical protein